MKTHIDTSLAAQGEYVDLETLLEQGRQLHSEAVFAFCAGIFKRLTCRSLFQKPGFSATGKDLRTVGSD